MDVFLNCEKENLLDTENLRKIHIVINDRSGQNLQIDNFIKPLIQQEFHFVEKIELAHYYLSLNIFNGERINKKIIYRHESEIEQISTTTLIIEIESMLINSLGSSNDKNRFKKQKTIFMEQDCNSVYKILPVFLKDRVFFNCQFNQELCEKSHMI